MLFKKDSNTRPGDLKWGAIAWLIGLPLPFVLLALLFGGCHGGY